MEQLLTPSNLRRLIVAHYSLEELRTLCFDLSVNFDDLPGETISGKARELILLLGRQHRLDQLLTCCQRNRPAAFDFPTDPTALEVLYTALPSFGETDQALLPGEQDRAVASHPPRSTVDRVIKVDSDQDPEREYVCETLHSTLLPVLKMPSYVYGVPCEYDDSQEKEAAKKIIHPENKAEMYPFIIRGGMLWCFQNLRYKGGPFRELVGDQKVRRFQSRTWWNDPDRMRWFMNLLNRSLNKLTGRKGLNLDRKHRRYYFMPEQPGEPLEITYRPLNQSIATRQAVWQPITKKTGLPKRFWYHRAVALRFHRVADQHWCLSIRPEMHITKDGTTPLKSESIGSKVTRKKARMFNYDLLGEVHFWRDYLSDSQPRIILPFGKGQHILISSTLMQAEIQWPGMPEEYQKSFKNVEYPENLFSWAALQQLEDEYDEDDDDWEDGEEEEEFYDGP